MELSPEKRDQDLISRSRMFLLLGIFLFVGFLLTSVTSYLVSRKSIRQTILQDDLPLSSNNIYSEIQRDLFEPILISSLMANDTFVKDWILAGELDEKLVIRYLKQIKEKYGTITSFLVSESTRNYYHADSILKVVQETDPADAWFFRVREMPDDYETNVDPDMANKDAMTIFINYRIVDKSGKFLGTTGVGLTVNSVKTLMQNYREHFHRDVYFYNRQGELVLHGLNTSDEKATAAAHNAEPGLQRVLQKLDAGETDVSLSDVARNGSLINYRYIPELDWILLIEQTSDGTQPILIQSLAFNILLSLLITAILLSIIRFVVLKYQHRLETRNQQLLEKNIHIEQQTSQLAEANQKLDTMHREKDEFIGITVHDLKNPLNSVLGFTELLQEDSQLSGEAREYVDCISVSSREMLEQVEDLLKLTELEAPSTIPVTELNAVQTVRYAVNNHRIQAGAKKIQIDLQLPSHPILLRANEKWLISSIDNLISNAIKYSPSEGKIRISLRKEDGEAHIEVLDEGAGIPENEQNRLFKKFERLSSRPTAGESSSGLGLYLVRQMIERQGGRVWCVSSPGKGSTFHIALPASDPVAG